MNSSNCSSYNCRPVGRYSNDATRLVHLEFFRDHQESIRAFIHLNEKFEAYHTIDVQTTKLRNYLIDKYVNWVHSLKYDYELGTNHFLVHSILIQHAYTIDFNNLAKRYMEDFSTLNTKDNG